jgi:hypothetical protein
LPFSAKLGDGEGEGKAYAWMSFIRRQQVIMIAAFIVASKASWLIRQKMSDDVCIAVSM